MFLQSSSVLGKPTAKRNTGAGAMKWLLKFQVV
nr:MAG TPA: hypothetical protein [Caudoviricetes sp.]DAQ42904.1 MAG TPA: hypothetical protein [Caudoviricetes sp.]